MITAAPVFFRGVWVALLLAAPAGAAEEKSPGYFRPALSYGTQPETDPPRYVRTLSKTGIAMFRNLTWLEGGAQFRYRYEHRDNDLRRSGVTVDDPSLLRTRAYLGIREIADPLRAAVEFQDSRRYHSQFARDDRDWNPYEFIQAYGELHFSDGLAGKTTSLRAGRMAFEALDRRLIARNEWRNTTNTFQGVRAQIGRQEDAYAFDSFLFQPITRKTDDVDIANDRLTFFGAIAHIRRYSDRITLQPFYLGLRQNGRPGLMGRVIHSPGIRGYGEFGSSGFDYDTSLVYQFGHQGGQDHRAAGAVAEIGYRLDHPWKPRVSLNYGYGSGDRNPADSNNERFERFYGFARPWSNNDYFQWENLHAPKCRVEFQPVRPLRIDAGYNGYWLASDTDRWNNAGLRDTGGNSGDFIGHEFDIRTRYRIAPQVDANLGYAHFEPGNFVRNRARADASEFFYLELTFSLFE